MAQWNHADRTLHTKLVYYGPAYGGKTTNLESLHRITDPQAEHKLLSVKTSNDRTLFFDLLPFDLGDILGYQVAMKLYTVPGQVRYDTTRQVVLSGADGIIFVADSSADRREQNVWSLQNLRMNMRAKKLDASRVPLLYQYNKQDMPGAATPDQVASWLGVPCGEGFPSIAVNGQGVLETFIAASRATLERLVAVADDRTRQQIDSGELSRQIDRAFAPHLARRIGHQATSPPADPGQGRAPIVVQGDDLLERAVDTGVRLGEKYSAEQARARRLETEAEAFRLLSESLRSVGANFDRNRNIDAALEAVRDVLRAPVVTLISDPIPGEPALERASGRSKDPLLEFEAGRQLLSRMRSTGGACVVDELQDECPEKAASEHLRGLRAAAAVPVEKRGLLTLVAYAPQPDGVFLQPDVRFMATVAGHLAAGLEKSRLHEDLERHRDRLEDAVGARTRQLRKAYEDLREMDQTKDRFLCSLSHEMKSPLTAVLSAAYVIRDYDSSPKERKELVASIVSSGEMLKGKLDDLFRLVNLESADQPLNVERAEPARLVEEAIQLSGRAGIQYKIVGLVGPVPFDLHVLARAIANLIDNAVKFSPPSSLVKIEVAGSSAEDGGATDTLVLSVLDRGPGVVEEDRERIFAPFEQGGDPLTGKPVGIGIGLYEARKIAERHGGKLVHLPREGGGSRFCLTVPLEPAGEPQPAMETVGA